MSDWTGAIIEVYRGLWIEGYSTSQIGERIGFSKNAVVSKSRRLIKDGVIPPRPDHAHKKVARTPELLSVIERMTENGIGRLTIARTLGVGKDLVDVIRREIGVPPPPVVAAPKPPPPPTPAPIPRREGGRRQCEWLSGDQKPYVRCQGEREPGSSYCLQHSRDAYPRWDQRRTEAVA